MDKTTIIQLTSIQQTLRQTYSTKTLKTTRRSGQEVTGSITLNAHCLPCPRILSVITQVQGVTVILLKQSFKRSQRDGVPPHFVR